MGKGKTNNPDHRQNLVNFKKGFDPRRNLKGRPKDFNIREVLKEITAMDGTMTFDRSECEITDDEVIINIGNAEGVFVAAFRKAMNGDTKAIGILFKAWGFDTPMVQNIQNNIQVEYNFDLLDKDTKIIVLEALKQCRVGPTEISS